MLILIAHILIRRSEADHALQNSSLLTSIQAHISGTVEQKTSEKRKTKELEEETECRERRLGNCSMIVKKDEYEK